MNILKNMEFVFVAALALAASALYANAALPSAQAAANVALNVPTVQVVSVVGKRMTAQEKAQSLLDERRQASVADTKSAI